MSYFSNIISTAVRAWVPQLTVVRHRYYAEKVARGPLVRRHGYHDPIDQRGLLPHTGDGRKIPELPIYKPTDVWHEKRALFGQNDYIDILGDERIHPTRISYNVPAWLRGVKGIEYRVLIRKEKMLKRGIFPVARPTKWRQMKKRISYLYRYLNRNTKTYFSPTA